MSTSAGRDIMKQGMLKSRAYKQFLYYKEEAEESIKRLSEELTHDLHRYIIDDNDPKDTLTRFVQVVNSKELLLDESDIEKVRGRVSNMDILRERVIRILDSNFVKMTLPVFTALVDGANEYLSLGFTKKEKEILVNGHIIAIDLSEPMDRIIDKDEDIEYLDDYKLLNPYMLKIAREKIGVFGNDLVDAFEEGFRDALDGQYIDYILKSANNITLELMDRCYKKYRAVMGTAGMNMALRKSPLGEIFYYGMAKAGESVGCGNELEDSLKSRYIKNPSWPLYYLRLTNNLHVALDLTLKKANIYLGEAELALDMLPDNFTTKPFLEFLFLTVRHYNQYWYNQIIRSIDKLK